MTHEVDLADYRWLVGDGALDWLRLVVESDKPLHVLVSDLRKKLSVDRARLVIQQIDLRRRGRVKFGLSDQMFFTQQGLEQATDEVVAAHKAERFSPGTRVADLCCGIGGDLVLLRNRCQAVGVDRDPVVALFAEANCRAFGHAAEASSVDPSDPIVQICDIEEFRVEEVAAWHLDPDRRPEGRRTTHVDFHSPSREVMEQLLARNPNGAIKLAPAAECPEDWIEKAEMQWISSRRECRQLVVWFGDLAKHPQRRTATVLRQGTTEPRTVIGTVCDAAGDAADSPIPVSGRVDRFVHEPDAAVLAAGLSRVLAEQYLLSALSAKSAYLTGPVAIDDLALASFEVIDVLPYRVKPLKALLRERRIGRLEVKKRGVPLEPEQVRRDLRVVGDEVATLLLTPIAGKVTAILARRIARGN